MGRTPHPLGSTVCSCDCGRNTSNCRSMDSYRRNARCGCRGMECIFATRRSVDLHLVGSPRDRLGSTRPWCMVGRCPSFWLEAPRHSISQELSLALLRVKSYPLKEVVACPHRVYSSTQESSLVVPIQSVCDSI